MRRSAVRHGFEQRPNVTLDEYMEMITLKTSVLLAASLKLGAILGGATSGCSDVLYQFGKTLGIAFQLKDDYLDAFGSSHKTGKQIGGDILSNKKTYLSAKAYELASESDKQIFNDLLQRKDNKKVEDSLAFYAKLGVEKMLLDEIQSYTSKAYELLEKVPVISKRKIHLQDVADMLLKRDY
jgi:geranylgeranyl diphosphate synthase type II